jgi:hypothetical protein
MLRRSEVVETKRSFTESGDWDALLTKVDFLIHYNVIFVNVQTKYGASLAGGRAGDRTRQVNGAKS